MQSQSFNGVSIYIHTYIHTLGCRQETDDDRHTYTHPYLSLIFRVHQHTHTSRDASFIALPGALPLHTHTHKQLCTGDLLEDDTHLHTPILMPTLDCLHKLTFLLHVYRSVSLARMLHYTQLAYLFHQCATSLFSRDGRTADCTVRHPGVAPVFQYFKLIYMAWDISLNGPVGRVRNARC